MIYLKHKIEKSSAIKNKDQFRFTQHNNIEFDQHKVETQRRRFFGHTICNLKITRVAIGSLFRPINIFGKSKITLDDFHSI